jgi:type I restriction enzyme S subunit
MSVDFKKYVAGAAIPHIYFKDYKNETFIWMPLTEQQHIVSILDKCFKAIDKVKSNAERNLQNAKELFESYLNEIFENSRDDWEEKTLNDVCELITCGVAARPEYVDEGIPFLSAKNVKNGKIVWAGYNCISPETHKLLTKNNKPKMGDILYTRVGSYGEAAVVEDEIEFSVFVSLTLIKVDKSVLNNFFLKYYLNSETIKLLASKSITGQGVGNLNVGAVRKFPILLPSLKEQIRVVQEIEDLLSKTKKLEDIYLKKIKDLDELKKSFLQKAFSGELNTENIDV